MSTDLPTTPMTVDPEQVTHQTVDDEVIIIQLKRGNYFSLSGPGRQIWILLCAGIPPAEIPTQLRDRYSAEPEAIESSVSELVTTLLEESLIEAGPAGHPAQDRAVATEEAGSGHANGDRVPFMPSKLQKYTDLQDYLLIDPIHGVAEAGWPTEREDR
jgi:Coenzyme PQQ synthesis protein D (PqqD)